MDIFKLKREVEKNKSPFANKVKPIWSKEIYKVTGYSRSLYTLDDDTIYPKDKLQVVNKDNVMGEKKVSIKEEPPVVQEELQSQEPITTQTEPIYRLRSHTKAEQR
jgi:hypothetical protein